ncbi:MAG: DUF502 domain-containing protein [Planctomycetota bacterium]
MARPHFTRFFVRGLAVSLPSILTLALIIYLYNFIQGYVADPINTGIRSAVVNMTAWPPPESRDLDTAFAELERSELDEWESRLAGLNEQRQALGLVDFRGDSLVAQRRQWMIDTPAAMRTAQEVALDRYWGTITVLGWRVLDLIGLVVAVVLIYFAGLLLASYVGRKVYERVERGINSVPLIGRVYPGIKQITDFFVEQSERKPGQASFSRVVAVEYPRRGMWSVGLVTGATMRDIQGQLGVPSLTVFIPSSPTPFTGYVITVPETETVDIDVSIEDALKFAVSLGVLVPPSQQMTAAESGLDPADFSPAGELEGSAESGEAGGDDEEGSAERSGSGGAGG